MKTSIDAMNQVLQFIKNGEYEDLPKIVAMLNAAIAAEEAKTAPSGDREKLISWQHDRAKKYTSQGYPELANFATKTADMLAADAQEIAGWREDQKENLKNQMELQAKINDLKAQQVAVPQGPEHCDYGRCKTHGCDGVCLEPTPQPPHSDAQRVPMTRDQVDELAEDGCFLGNVYEITEAVEQFHGIKP